MILRSALSFARKCAPALFFVFTGFALLYGQDALLALTSYIQGASVNQGADMSGAEVAAEAQASGWLPFGLLTSKLLTATGAFCLACIAVWRMQRLVLPGPSGWAKEHYPAAFNSLPEREKFAVYQAGRTQLIALMIAALLFAALVQ